MNILDKIKDLIKQKAAKKIAQKAAKDVLGRIVERVREEILPRFRDQIVAAGGDITAAIEEAVKDEIKGIAENLVNEQIEKHVSIPENLRDIKDQIVAAAVDASVDMAYDAVKGALIGG